MRLDQVAVLSGLIVAASGCAAFQLSRRTPPGMKQAEQVGADDDALPDVEAHVVDPDTGRINRCDVTMRSISAALLSAELKRPWVAAYHHPGQMKDAWVKAVGRGLDFYATCDRRTGALWRTTGGAMQTTPVEKWN